MAPEERNVFLNEACADDPILRQEVESLLAADESVGDFFRGVEQLARPKSGPGLALRHLGAYKLVHKIGEGGLSVVYLASRDDEAYAKRVAIKVLRRGLESDLNLERLRTERQILAALDHPNIASLLDGGTSPDGVPYLVMEYIQGVPIDRHCEASGLTVRHRLELFLEVCAAVQYAHRNLVVHRDLKPSNILVRADGTVKLLDFGIAKLLNPELTGTRLEPTRFDGRLMTPEYASPEQMRGETITTASDVYSLGVVLYKLLTGEIPYALKGISLEEMAQLIRDSEPVPPSFRDPALAGDLDTIVLKALRKEPDRRYGSVDQLVEDLRRHLVGFPVLARKATTAYRLGKFVRRNRLSVALGSLVAILLIAFGISMAAQSVRIAASLEVAERERAKVTAINEFLQETLGSADPQIGSGRDVTVLEALQQARERIEPSLEDQPEIEAAVRHTIGSTFLSLGRYGEAEPLLRSALESRRRLLGREHLEVAETLERLGVLLDKKGDYAGAEALLQETLDLRQRLLGQEHPDVARVLNEQGNLQASKGELGSAESLHRKALEMRRKLLGEGHPDISESEYNLAVVVWKRGNLAEARTLFRQALALDRELHGDERSPQVASSLHGLGIVLSTLGEYEEGESILRTALESTRRVWGDEHPVTVDVLNSLGLVLLWKEDYAAAEKHFRQALAMAESLHGSEHSQVSICLDNLGRVLRQRGDLEEAEEMHRRALQMTRLLLGEDHPAVAMSQGALGLVRLDRGDYTDAERLLDQSLQGLLRSFPATHWRIARAQSDHGLCLMKIGRFGEAEELLRAAIPALERSLGKGHKYTRLAFERLAELQKVKNRRPE